MSRRRASTILTGALALAGVVVATAPATVRPVAAAPAIRFATPTVVDPTSIYGEPDLRADPAHPGTWYASGPWGTGTQRSIWDRSLDGAHTFRALHDHPDPVHTGGSMVPPGGGDTEIAVDHTGKVYMADLAALESQKAYTSTDMGATFAEQPLPPVFDDTKGTDRQWFGLWDPPAGTPVRSAYKGPWPVNYMVYLKAGATQTSNAETVASSVPNGADQSRVGLDYACAPGAVGGGACPQWLLGNDGYVAIDQVTGRVVQAIGTTDAAGHEHIGVEVMTPGADGYMASATYHDIADLGHQNVGSIFPVITMDAARNVYAVWIANPDTDTDYVPGTSWQVFYSVARADAHDDWTQWSRPRRISAAPSNTSVMPWAVAGGDGNLDVAWYGTPSVLKRFDSESDPTVQQASWYLDMAQVTGASSGHPSTQQVQVVDRPMHHGSICLAGLGCITETGNRNLADFFEITTDASGAAYIVYDNTANDLIQQVPLTETGLPEGVVDHRGAEIVMVARQIGGPSLNGGSVDAPDDHGVSGIRSAAGDARYDPVGGGTSYPGLDVLGTSLTLEGDHLHVVVDIADPSQAAAAAQAIGAAFVDVVVRWEFQDTVYFASVEVPATGAPATFFDGRAQSVDLCSVSACDPHVIIYPGPTIAPMSSHVVAGGQITAASAGSPGAVVLDVPVADVGGPRTGDRLASVGAYTLVSSTSALLPLPNPLAEADVVPVEVDGACCFTPILGAAAAQGGTPATPTGPTPAPTGSALGTTTGVPNTAAPGRGAAVPATVVALGALGVVLRRRRRSSR